MKHLYLFAALLSLAFANAQTIGLQTFATGISSPVEITNAGDSRIFAVQQDGKIRIIQPSGTINATPFLNIGSLVSSGGERGLLGLAFHPDYVTNGYFFVNYTNTSGNTVIARYSVSTSDPNIANPASAMILLTVTQPFSNHNGGTLRFGPDGYLYIGMGDGGSGGDPNGNGQNKNVLLGKMLRLDVNNGTPYGIPPTNPYVGTAGADEIWAIGLRNPWKFSFDLTDGNLWIADVGQENVEEINKIPAADAGLNFGWKCYEGNAVYSTSNCPAPGAVYTFPYVQYSSANGSGNCSVTGGFVYRGSAYLNFQGRYFFADYCSDKIGMVNSAAQISYSQTFDGNNFTTFGQDMNKELYVAGASSETIYKVIDTSLGVPDAQKTSFVLSPNPAQTVATLQTQNAVFPVELSVFDLTGKRLLTETFQADNATLHLETLQKGIYFVTAQDRNGAKSNSKLAVE